MWREELHFPVVEWFDKGFMVVSFSPARPAGACSGGGCLPRATLATRVGDTVRGDEKLARRLAGRRPAPASDAARAPSLERTLTFGYFYSGAVVSSFGEVSGDALGEHLPRKVDSLRRQRQRPSQGIHPPVMWTRLRVVSSGVAPAESHFCRRSHRLRPAQGARSAPAPDLGEKASRTDFDPPRGRRPSPRSALLVVSDRNILSNILSNIPGVIPRNVPRSEPRQRDATVRAAPGSVKRSSGERRLVSGSLLGAPRAGGSVESGRSVGRPRLGLRRRRRAPSRNSSLGTFLVGRRTFLVTRFRTFQHARGFPAQQVS
eukprot:1195929-Prorocentrum_minimum.AAC.7